MVEIICPYCGAGADGTPNSDNIAEWYATYHPHLPVGSTVPDVCSVCAVSYSAGDSVVLRSKPHGTVYTVVALVSSPGNPDMVTVRHPDGHEPTFAKSWIQPQANSNVLTPSPVKRDGYF